MRVTTADLAAMGYGADGKRLRATGANTGVERESDLHDAILAYCRARGWAVVHSRMDRPATCGVGTPDFVIALPDGRTLWVEAKAGKGKLRPEQAAWMAKLGSLGHTTAVVRSMEEFVGAVEQLKGKETE